MFREQQTVIVEGGSHGALAEVLRESPAVRDKIWQFVATGDLTGFPDRVALPNLDWVMPATTN